MYNETVFQAIDYILDQMADSGIRVIIALIDYWKQTDGVQQARSTLASCAVKIRALDAVPLSLLLAPCMQYVNWCAGGNLDSFFTNSYCQQLYQNHVKTFVNRCAALSIPVSPSCLTACTPMSGFGLRSCCRMTACILHVWTLSRNPWMSFSA